MRNGKITRRRVAVRLGIEQNLHDVLVAEHRPLQQFAIGHRQRLSHRVASGALIALHLPGARIPIGSGRFQHRFSSR